MRTLTQACKDTPLEYSDELPEGGRAVFAQIDGVFTCIGRLMPEASQATLEASPGIQAWSHPRGKVATRLFDKGASILQFSKYWERHWQRTYPLHDEFWQSRRGS
jgi:hypothetical protein